MPCPVALLEFKPRPSGAEPAHLTTYNSARVPLDTHIMNLRL